MYLYTITIHIHTYVFMYTYIGMYVCMYVCMCNICSVVLLTSICCPQDNSGFYNLLQDGPMERCVRCLEPQSSKTGTTQAARIKGDTTSAFD